MCSMSFFCVSKQKLVHSAFRMSMCGANRSGRAMGQGHMYGDALLTLDISAGGKVHIIYGNINLS